MLHLTGAETSASQAGGRDAPLYDAAGLLTQRTVMAHGVCLTDEELSLLARRGSGIAHCPLSNFFFADLPLDVIRVRRAGVKVCHSLVGCTRLLAVLALVFNVLPVIVLAKYVVGCIGPRGVGKEKEANKYMTSLSSTGATCLWNIQPHPSSLSLCRSHCHIVMVRMGLQDSVLNSVSLDLDVPQQAMSLL